jgi:hypothetical protein
MLGCVYVVLVHGTWGRRSPWTYPDGDLTRTLLERLPAGSVVRRFEWRGGNWHRQRIRAALELAQSIDSIPDSDVGIVAHSHGGNVARAAVAEMKTPKNVRVVSVGTPFLTVESTKPRPRNWIFYLLAALVVVDAAVQWNSPNIGWEFLKWSEPTLLIDPDPTRVRVVLGVGAAVAVMALVWRLVSWLVGWPLRTYRPQRLADMIAPSGSAQPVLALGVTGDEAGLALTVGQALTYVGKRTSEALTRYVLSLLPIVALLIVASIVLDVTELVEAVPEQYRPSLDIVYYMITLVWGAAVVALVLFLVETAGVIVTGWDGAALPLGHINISVTPPGRHRVGMLLPASTEPRLAGGHATATCPSTRKRLFDTCS